MAFNSRSNIIGYFSDAAVKGPVLMSQVFDKELQTLVEVAEFEVSNLSTIPTDLPFGLLAGISQANKIKARLQVRICPGFFTPDGPVWPTNATKIRNFSELISVAEKITQVVPLDYDIGTLPYTDVWEAEVSAIDDRHGLLTVVRAIVTPEQEEDAWDEKFRLYVKVKRQLVQEKETPSVDASSGGFTRIEYQTVKPDWWIRITSIYVIPETGFSVENVNEFVRIAQVRQTLESVAFNMSTLDTLNLWEAEMTPINSQFSLLTRTYVLEGLNASESIWDPETKAAVVVTKTLTQTYVAPALTGTFPNLTHTEYQILRPTWWLRVSQAYSIGAITENIIALTGNLQLPAVLQSLTVVWNKASGEGGFSTDWQGISAGTHFALAGNERGEAQSSGSLQPELLIEISEAWARNVPTRGLFFFLPFASKEVTKAAILTKVNAMLGVTAAWWPQFKPVAHSIVAKGMKVNVSATASANASLSASESNITTDKTQGEGTSFDISTSVNAIRLPPTIHPAISVLGLTADTVSISATAEVGWDGSGTITFPSADASATAGPFNITAGVSPTSFGATSPATIPSSGYYILDVKVEPHPLGIARCFVEVLNAAEL